MMPTDPASEDAAAGAPQEAGRGGGPARGSGQRPGAADGDGGPVAAARALLRSGFKGALATLDRASGHPYASLVTYATAHDGSPLLLISQLALHTQNLGADARASLMIDGSGPDGDALANGRVSLVGQIEPIGDDAARDLVRARFLARHPSAALYADFADFVFHRFAVQTAHFIGGFGRIVDIAAQQLLTEIDDAQSLIAAEAEIVSHMNADHADALALYASHLLDQATTDHWQMIGIDPDGIDIAAAGRGLRLPFRQRVSTPGEARRELAHLARAARATSPGTGSDLT